MSSCVVCSLSFRLGTSRNLTFIRDFHSVFKGLTLASLTGIVVFV